MPRCITFADQERLDHGGEAPITPSERQRAYCSTLLDEGIDHPLGHVDHDMAEQITAPV
jgi:hypothetical protein